MIIFGHTKNRKWIEYNWSGPKGGPHSQLWCSFFFRHFIKKPAIVPTHLKGYNCAKSISTLAQSSLKGCTRGRCSHIAILYVEKKKTMKRNGQTDLPLQMKCGFERSFLNPYGTPSEPWMWTSVEKFPSLSSRCVHGLRILKISWKECSKLKFTK